MLTKSLFLSAAVVTIGAVPFAATSAPILSEAYITVATGTSGSEPDSVTSPSIVEPGDPANQVAAVGNAFFGNFARQDLNGESEVNAQSSFGGSSDFELVTAQTIFTQGETNTTNATRQYFLDYTVQGLSADLTHARDQIEFDGPIVSEEPPLAFRGALPPQGTELSAVNPFGETASDIIASSVTAASFEYFIAVNGDNLFSTRADAMVSFEEDLQITGTGDFFDSATLTGNFIDGFEFNVGALLGRIELGNFAPGQDVIVTSSLIARAYSHDGGFFDLIDISECIDISSDSDQFCEEGSFFGNGVDSAFTDPIAISSIGSFAVNPSAVPLPAAGWMLLAGLGGLAAMRRKQKS